MHASSSDHQWERRRTIISIASSSSSPTIILLIISSESSSNRPRSYVLSLSFTISFVNHQKLSENVYAIVGFSCFWHMFSFHFRPICSINYIKVKSMMIDGVVRLKSTTTNKWREVQMDALREWVRTKRGCLLMIIGCSSITELIFPVLSSLLSSNREWPSLISLYLLLYYYPARLIIRP